MMMAYESKRYSKDWKREEQDVCKFVQCELERCHDNQLTEARISAESGHAAMGKLVEILAAKKILNMDDILEIIGRSKNRSSWEIPDGETPQQNHTLIE